MPLRFCLGVQTLAGPSLLQVALWSLGVLRPTVLAVLQAEGQAEGLSLAVCNLSLYSKQYMHMILQIPASSSCLVQMLTGS